MASQIRWRAVKAPIVRSVMAMSLLGVSVGYLETSLDGSHESNNVEMLEIGFLIIRNPVVGI